MAKTKVGKVGKSGQSWKSKKLVIGGCFRLKEVGDSGLFERRVWAFELDSGKIRRKLIFLVGFLGFEKSVKNFRDPNFVSVKNFEKF